ncbi:MAG: glycosyltransferase family 2 protein [Planctomycetes bacterium]|nr:glycosyltransferase family 2 protein [Planctomycetota bacterium]
MDVSIVITSYNTRDLLAECLQSVRASTGDQVIETFVVDNGSHDGSAAMVERDFPEVRLLVNDANLGFSRASNRALEASTGRYVLLLNPDTRLRPETIACMVRTLDDRPEVGLAGVKLVRPDGDMDRACRRGFPTPLNSLTKMLKLDRAFPRSRVLGGYNLTWQDPDGDYEVDAIVGAFMFMRREVIEEVGMLDERFFMFGEDLDWCWRIRRSAWQVLYLGSHEVLHVKGASVRQNPVEMNAHFHRAMYIFHKKHLENRYPFFVNWAVQAGIGVRWLGRSAVLRMRRRLEEPGPKS